MRFLKSFLPVGLVILAGCAAGNCRKNQMNDGINLAATPMEGAEVSGKPNEAAMATKPTDRIRVFKYDGSLQCNQGKAVPVETMQKELKNIQVFNAENKADSLMRIQQCGTATGKANVFEIDRKDLDAAKKLGFQLWTFD